MKLMSVKYSAWRMFCVSVSPTLTSHSYVFAFQREGKGRGGHYLPTSHYSRFSCAVNPGLNGSSLLSTPQLYWYVTVLQAQDRSLVAAGPTWRLLERKL